MTVKNETAAARKAAERDAAKAEAHANAKTVTITHDGEKYDVHRGAIDVEVLELIEDDKVISALRRVLNPEQWSRFKDHARDDDGLVPPDSMDGLMQAIVDGLGLGNS